MTSNLITNILNEYDRCDMSCITIMQEEKQLTSITISVFVTNLFRIKIRIFCALFAFEPILI